MDTLTGLGFELPSLAYIAGALIFGIFGWSAFNRGRKAGFPDLKWGGLVLMLYPYAVPEKWMLWAIGVALTGWLFARWK